MSLFPKPISCSELEKSWKQHLAEIFAISLLGIPTGLMFCQTCFDSPGKLLIMYLYSGAIWISQWKGHSFLNDLLDTKINWFDNPGKRFILTVLILITYPPVSLTIVHYLVQEFLHVNTGYFTWAGFKQINIIAVSIGGAITLFSFSSFFLKNWRQAEINAAKLRSENISSQFEALKSQVNPHFLFNSLNVLTSLVYEDQNKAAQFIKKLSDVYRYVLEQKGKDLVDLSNELEFVRSYLFLQKIRFGNNLKVEFDLANEMKYKVAPLSIQMLIENAIKHNIVSKEDPLRIVISLNGDNQLEVSNNLQKKNVMEGDSQGIGLENIKQRYAYLTDIEVSVEQIDGRFVVKLPLIVES